MESFGQEGLMHPGTPVARSITLFSEGTRLAAELYVPTTPAPEGGYPAILLCHGWGGYMHQLVPNAQLFARSGYVVMIFDYRGWGESDGRIIATSDAPRLLEAGEQTMKVHVLREIVDPIDQTTDIRNCIAYLASETEVNPGRVGIWGTSFGGGNVVFSAGHDKRIRAVVAQIGAYGLPEMFRDQARKREVDKVRGAIEPVVPQGGIDAPPGLVGTPDLARFEAQPPLAAAGNIRVPTLIIDAEQEELINRLEHGWTAHMIIRQHAISEYKTFPCQHYGMYDQFYEESTALALDWFGRYL
jgi:dienelactone hydrolase